MNLNSMNHFEENPDEDPNKSNPDQQPKNETEKNNKLTEELALSLTKEEIERRFSAKEIENVRNTIYEELLTLLNQEYHLCAHEYNFKKIGEIAEKILINDYPPALAHKSNDKYRQMPKKDRISNLQKKINDVMKIRLAAENKLKAIKNLGITEREYLKSPRIIEDLFVIDSVPLVSEETYYDHSFWYNLVKRFQNPFEKPSQFRIDLHKRTQELIVKKFPQFKKVGVNSISCLYTDCDYIHGVDLMMEIENIDQNNKKYKFIINIDLTTDLNKEFYIDIDGQYHCNKYSRFNHLHDRDTDIHQVQNSRIKTIGECWRDQILDGSDPWQTLHLLGSTDIVQNKDENKTLYSSFLDTWAEILYKNFSVQYNRRRVSDGQKRNGAEH